MTARADTLIRAGETKRVVATLRRQKPEPAVFTPEGCGPALDCDAAASGLLALNVFDAGAQGWTRRDASGEYTTFDAIRLESGPFTSPLVHAANRNAVFAAIGRGPYAYAGSGRAAPSSLWPWPDNPLIDGYNARLSLVRTEDGAEIRRAFPIVSAAPYWHRLTSARERLATWLALEPYLDRQRSTGDFERTEAELRGLARERTLGSAVTGQDATLAAPIEGGRWALTLECPAHAHPFDCFDEVNYRVTALPYNAAPRVDPRFGIVNGDARRVRVYSCPQRHRYTGQYYAIFAFTVLWWTTLTHQPVTFTFVDRLPFAPAYTFTSAYDTSVNDQSVSRWIAGSRALDLARRGDRGQEYFSPWMAKQLTERVLGRWSLREFPLPAGELAAVVDVDYPAETRRTYVWRETTAPRNGLFDFGPLSVPADQLDQISISPFDKSNPGWQFAPDYTVPV